MYMILDRIEMDTPTYLEFVKISTFVKDCNTNLSMQFFKQTN